jgi:hypothetical protein
MQWWVEIVAGRYVGEFCGDLFLGVTGFPPVREELGGAPVGISSARHGVFPSYVV